MGRSVASLRNADRVFYVNLEAGEEETDMEYIWDDFIENLSGIIRDNYPSLDKCKRSEDNEISILFENRLIEIGISEYCGLVSISLRAIENNYYHHLQYLGENFISRIADKFQRLLNERFDTLQRVGTFSSGEGVYSRIEAVTE